MRDLTPATVESLLLRAAVYETEADSRRHETRFTGVLREWAANCRSKAAQLELHNLTLPVPPAQLEMFGEPK